MKKLFDHIESLFEYYLHYFDESRPYLTHVIENKIYDFLNLYFPLLKNKKCFHISFDEISEKYIFKIDISFEEEIKINYPERLI